LIYWKESTAKHDIWKQEKNSGNTKEVVADFERRMSTEVKMQEMLKVAEEQDFRWGELPGRYIGDT